MLLKTVIMPIDENSLRVSKDILNCGGVVAFPTETVYGLGADATNENAIKSIYRIKGRPSDNPLIVHIHKDYDITSLVFDNDYAKMLRKAFLPGPLTMVYKSKGKVSPLVSCGLDTLALRVPSHAGCQEFLSYVNLPIAAPSANISKHVSPVTSSHVYKDLNGRIPLILEGGKSDKGIESTVLDVTGDIPVILREGVITCEMIKNITGVCETIKKTDTKEVKSPGLKYSHYMPECETMYFKRTELDKVNEVYDIFNSDDKKVYILCDDKISEKFKNKNLLNLGNDPLEITSNLYLKLREGEEKADIIIGIELENDKGLYSGVTNRMKKAFSVKN